MLVTKPQLKLINELVSHYNQHKKLFSSMIDSLESYIGNSENLKGLIHSKKSRIKDSDSLKDKLIRKADEANRKKKPFVYTKENLPDLELFISTQNRLNKLMLSCEVF
jgi:ppGpp synthetase/RelA/SpoT-type nucleotidyltranferase